MDRNTITGFLLIFAVLLLWTQLTGPTQGEVVEQQRIQDSIARAQSAADLQGREGPAPLVAGAAGAGGASQDSAQRAAAPTRLVTLENEALKVVLTSAGARIVSAELKEYDKLDIGLDGEELRTPILLLEDEDNEWRYDLGAVGSDRLAYRVSESAGAVTFTADVPGGGTFAQTYRLGDDYVIDHSVEARGVPGVGEALELTWVNYLDKIEKNVEYEQQNAVTYWKEVDENVDYVSASGEDVEASEGRVRWVSNSNQFFNSAAIANDAPFTRATLDSRVEAEDSENLKRLESKLGVPLVGNSGAFQLYVGPNEFDRLRGLSEDLEDVIPFGWSLFGTVNRWIIRPLFTFLSSFIGSAGLVIFTLTLIIKLALYPLTYKMLRSQAKMQALKPRLAKLREKHKDNQQEQQMATMKVYREYGVNPAGGCLPMMWQMPIWFALYRFFPASIEFRQEGFLWASDLSSYDEFVHLPFTVPFYGDHVSMFTLLWVVTTIAYTYYNSKMMDMGQMANNPALKYMQYGMPVMFLFFFNNFAAGLTVYLVFSNLMNITQTLVTKNLVIDHDKIEAELKASKAKPKKKSGFGARLEEALKQQQEIAAQRAKKG